jgi:hypothetical protein
VSAILRWIVGALIVLALSATWIDDMGDMPGYVTTSTLDD